MYQYKDITKLVTVDVDESVVNEASEDRMIKQIERALKDGTSIFKLPMATQNYYNKNKGTFESVVTEASNQKWKVVDSNGNEVAGPDAKHIMVDYAKQKRGWKAVKVAESVVTEAKNTIGLAFKEEQDYLDFKEFVAEQPRGAIRKNIGFDSKTKSWNVEMDVKILDSIYGEGTPSDKKSGWYGGLPDDFESVIIESVVTEARNYKESPDGKHKVKATVCYIKPMSGKRECKAIYFKSKHDALGFKDNVKGFPKGAAVEAIKESNMKYTTLFEEFIKKTKSVSSQNEAVKVTPESDIKIDDYTSDNGEEIKAVEIVGAISSSETEDEFLDYFYDAYGQGAFTETDTSTLVKYFNDYLEEITAKETEEEEAEKEGGGEEEDPLADLDI